MAIEEPEIEQGIKRRPSNRDQLLSKAIKDTSEGCHGQKTGEHAKRRVSQITPQNDQPAAVPAPQNHLQPHSELPEHVSVLKDSTAPVVAIGIQVGDPIPTMLALHSHPIDHFAAQLPIPLLQEYHETQTDLDNEQSQTLMETRLEGLEIQKTFSGSGVVVSPLEYIPEPLSTLVERGNLISEDLRRGSFEDAISSRASNKSRSNRGSITYTIPGAWPKSNPGSTG